MSSKRRVAVVTGGNRGIGLHVVAALCETFDGDVFLTARDESRGNAAIEQLNRLHLQPKFHQLDVTDRESIRRLRDHLREHYGGLDVLVNNAGIGKDDPLSDWLEIIVRTNFFGVLYTCEELFPLLRPHARVVNISSLLGMLKYVQNKELQEKLADPGNGRAELSGMMEQYIKDFKDGVWENTDRLPHPYMVSKAAVIALTFIQQREFDRQPTDDLVVNAVHPGYVDTEMVASRTFKDELLTPEEGAKAPTSLAFLPRHVKSPRGEYVWYNGDIVNWKAEKAPHVYIYRNGPQPV